jgi:hypothetical protein
MAALPEFPAGAVILVRDSFISIGLPVEFEVGFGGEKSVMGYSGSEGAFAIMEVSWRSVKWQTSLD